MRASLLNLCRIVVRNTGDQRKQTVYLSHVKWVRQIEKYFSRFGKVEDVSLFFDSETGLHRGFASLKFSTQESAVKVTY
uniref:RRM domain-containing protein n=1 Tax=Rhabditophanes sp. KR3021 TaxID=114890 RepID=A0AC35UAU8_9BILA